MAEPLHILILEDQPADAELTVRELRRAGFEPRWTRVDTEEAYSSSLSPELDVILADYRLPQFDAERALAVLNESKLEVPFIVLSGTIGEETAVRAMQQGAADYLLKDRLGRLGHAVRAALERRRLREEARHAEERYRNIVQNAIEGIFQSTPDGEILVANPAFAHIYGCESLAELKAAYPSMNAAFSDKDLATIQAELRSVKTIRDFEAKVQLADGSVKWLSLNIRAHGGNGKPAYREGSAQDITRRKSAEAAVVRSEARFKALFGSDAIGLFVVDTQGQIIEGNARFLAMLGYLESDLPLSWLGLTAPEFIDRDRLAVRQIDEFGRLKPWEKAFVHADGHSVPCLVGGVRLPERTGLCFALDLTEIKTAQARLERANKQLEEAMETVRKTQETVIAQERLRALGEMASGIAHDFNNALSPIIGFTEILMSHPEQLKDEALLQKRLNLIHRSGLDAAQTVRRLREFFRTKDDADGVAVIDVAEIAKEAIELTQPRWANEAMAEGIQYRVNSTLEPVRVVGSASELREMVVNLLLNALDAMPNGGDLDVSVTPLDEASVEVIIRDDGVGMTPEVRAHCFEPFFTTKGSSGTGLGLAMCYGIVKRHDGEITIESEVGKGTTLRITLPVAKPAVDVKAPARAEPIPPIQVLLIDDDPKARIVIAEYLRLDRHDVLDTDDPFKALASLRSGSFGVVITDRAMPQMSGDQVAMQVKRFNEKIPVLMLTGFGDLMTAAGERPEAVDAVISKPVTLEHLRAALRAVVGGAPAQGAVPI